MLGLTRAQEAPSVLRKLQVSIEGRRLLSLLVDAQYPDSGHDQGPVPDTNSPTATRMPPWHSGAGGVRARAIERIALLYAPESAGAVPAAGAAGWTMPNGRRWPSMSRLRRR